MNNEVKTLWLTALRSGEYKQASSRLRVGDKFCCLGVLCDLYTKATGKGKWEERFTEQEEDERRTPFAVVRGDHGTDYEHYEDHYPPREVYEWAGITQFANVQGLDRSSVDPLTKQVSGLNELGLASLNDSGKTFEAIADVIESDL